MKLVMTWAVIALLGLSFLSGSAFAVGDCAGKKSSKPVKKITQSDSTGKKSG